MVFSSHLFLFYFLTATLAAYCLSPQRGRHLILTLFSFVFYGWANPLFVVLMMTTIVINYVCGLLTLAPLVRSWRDPIPLLERNGPRTALQRGAVAVAVIANLGILGFFKYFNFGIESYNDLMVALGFDDYAWRTFLRITLPLGISFYTFQAMSYSIDVYRGDARAIRHFIDFACYVSMFPQLVAGPIIRFQEVADQLIQRTHTAEKFARGVTFICLGFAKKILLANTCGKVADMAFDASAVNFADAWMGVLGYSFQIYFDFSAYSDMAIGLGLLFGFVFPKNFDSPYISQSITEFWRRWHISLSTWLRDYLYIPLGGNRKGPARTYVNLAIVMLLGGLWHGAAWNFVIWGGIHGVMLAFERMQGKDSVYRNLPRPVRMAITFIIVCFTWVFFRAETLDRALAYCGSMIGLGPGTAEPGAALIGAVIYQPYYVLAMITAATITWFGVQTWDFTRKITMPKAVLIVGLLWVSVVVLTTQSFNPFIYFIF